MKNLQSRRKRRKQAFQKMLMVIGASIIGVFMVGTIIIASRNGEVARPDVDVPASGPAPVQRETKLRADAVLGLRECVPSGKGRDYQVGPGGGDQRAALDDVPWDRLMAGDTVRIHYQPTPYKGKFILIGEGTRDAPIRICGVRGPNGERPVIEGNDAPTRSGLESVYGSAQYSQLFQARAIVMIKADHSSRNAWTSAPQHIQIDGLHIRGAAAGKTFRTSNGAVAKYDPFGACIWIDRGDTISLIDNEISDCTNGIFSKSTNDGEFAITRNLRIAGNYIHGNGVVGDDHEHNAYVQGRNVVYEFNRFGPLRPGARGNAIKDRSIGTVVRFNRIEEGAHAIDLVEAEDFALTAAKDPNYRSSFVYGNQIVKSGDTGSFIHYGGDHYGSTPTPEITATTWGEPLFRKGTLFFFNNTVVVTSRSGYVFQLATTEEKAEVWNNIFVTSGDVSTGSIYLRAPTSGLGAAWTSGGQMRLGVNWISAGWSDSEKYHPAGGNLQGKENVLSGRVSPIHGQTLMPLAKSAVIDAGQSGPSIPGAHAVTMQLNAQFLPEPRPIVGAAIDLGALEWQATGDSGFRLSTLWWAVSGN